MNIRSLIKKVKAERKKRKEEARKYKTIYKESFQKELSKLREQKAKARGKAMARTRVYPKYILPRGTSPLESFTGFGGNSLKVTRKVRKKKRKRRR